MDNWIGFSLSRYVSQMCMISYNRISIGSKSSTWHKQWLFKKIFLSLYVVPLARSWNIFCILNVDLYLFLWNSHSYLGIIWIQLHKNRNLNHKQKNILWTIIVFTIYFALVHSSDHYLVSNFPIYLSHSRSLCSFVCYLFRWILSNHFENLKVIP